MNPSVAAQVLFFTKNSRSIGLGEGVKCVLMENTNRQKPLSQAMGNIPSVGGALILWPIVILL